MDLLPFLILGGLGLVFALCGLLAYRSDRSAWNNGQCPECSRPWRRFSRDMESPRGYECDRCDEIIWISFAVEAESKTTSEESSQSSTGRPAAFIAPYD